MLSEAVDRRGRYVGARTQKPITDLAVDATLRAAAPHQIERGWTVGEPLLLEPEDLRQKVREHKVGSLVIFVIDGSGSMDAEHRMASTKAVSLSLLRDAYVRRDRVAAIVFRRRTAEIVLQPTSSVSLAERRLADMPVGGRTPLAHGLLAGYEVARRERRLDPTVSPLIVLVSDGRSNVALGSGDPLAEAYEVADRIRRDGMDSLVVDSSASASTIARRKTPMYDDLRPGRCLDIANHMGGLYVALGDLSAADFGRLISRVGRRRRGSEPSHRGA
jgi:magnesium chelatase subunit D